jgi:hypothetical protein
MAQMFHTISNKQLIDITLSWLHRIEGFIPLIAILLGVGLLLWAARFIGARRWLLKRRLTYLELTPPASASKHPLATGKLFSVLHSLGMTITPTDKLLKRKLVWSLEVPASREHGIRYVVGVTKREVTSFRHIIAGYLPEVQVRVIEDYLPANFEGRHVKVIEFKQTGHFAYPLERHDDLETFDPMSHLTSAMTQLKSGELMVLQLIVSPVHLRHASAITAKLLNNEDLLTQLSKKRASILTSLLRIVFSIINKLLSFATSLVTELVNGSSSSSYNSAQRDAYDRRQVAQRLKPARQLGVLEAKLMASIDHKVRQLLFQVSIRALVVAESKQEAAKRMSAVKASLASFTVPKYQSLGTRRGGWIGPVNRYRMFALRNRLSALLSRHSSVLSVSEVADIYHFPHPVAAKTENVVKSLSKTLPAPVAIKKRADNGDSDYDLFDYPVVETHYLTGSRRVTGKVSVNLNCKGCR